MIVIFEKQLSSSLSNKERIMATMNKQMIEFKDLVKMGFPVNQARNIIREVKAILISRGYGFYNGKRVGLVPSSVVAEIIGLPSLDEGDD